MTVAECLVVWVEGLVVGIVVVDEVFAIAYWCLSFADSLIERHSDWQEKGTSGL